MLFLLMGLLSFSPGLFMPSHVPERPFNQETGTLEIEPLELDFGKVFDGDEPVKTVKLRNNGSGTLTIKRISTTCGCAVPRVTFPGNKEVIIGSRPAMGHVGVLEPDQEATMDVVFTTHGYTGTLKKQITVETDDGTRAVRIVKVLAEIIDSVQFEPAVLDLGEVVRGKRVRGKVVIRSVGIGDFDVVGFRKRNEYVKLIEPQKLKSGEHAEVALEVETRENAPLGKWMQRFNLDLENEHVNSARLTVQAEVVPKIRFSLEGRRLSDEVDFGVFSRDAGKELAVEIKNLAPSIPYVPLDVKIEHGPFESFLEKKLEEVTPGVHYRLLLSVKPGVGAPGFLRGKVNIRSDHPDIIQKTFYLSGWSR